MNINFNLLIQKLLPYIFILLLAYLLNSILFFFLPKFGVDFKESLVSTLEYKKYSGFYTNVQIVQEQKVNENIQSLSKYELKAIYSTPSNGGWITVQKAQDSYILSQGENIDGYVLKKLFKNFVIFERNSKEYKLELKSKDDVSFELVKTNENINQEIITKDDGALITREYLNSYIKDIDKIWNNIEIKELKDGEKIVGFEIVRITKDSAFDKLGLKAGDVIKAVNNNQLGSYAEAFNVYNGISNTQYLNIEVLRNNERMELNYEIN